MVKKSETNGKKGTTALKTEEETIKMNANKAKKTQKTQITIDYVTVID